MDYIALEDKVLNIRLGGFKSSVLSPSILDAVLSATSLYALCFMMNLNGKTK